MNVLILTPINPVWAGNAYKRITDEIKRPDNVGFLCYPFFAEMKCQMENKPYLPVFFAMLKAAQKEEMNKKLFDKKINIFIGNCYKSQDFDIIVAIDELDAKNNEGQPYDGYLETITSNEMLDEFRDKVGVEQMFTLDDAEIILPTIKHAITFVQGVIKNGIK